MSKIAILGSGTVGQTLADGFLGAGHEVMRGTREPSKLSAWKTDAGSHASVGTFADAAAFGEIIVLAVKGGAAEDVMKLAGLEHFAGKIVIDPTNPIADLPPEDGVLKYFTGPNESLMERLQAQAPKAHFVKAFSCVGAPNFINPNFGSAKPTMFICGNDESAKASVAKILNGFQWDVADMGSAVAARAIEPMCMLWCIPGFTQNSWTHAFALLKR